MKDKIKAFVWRMNHASFAELTRVIPNTAGQRMMLVNNDSVMIWQGVSVEFAGAIEELLRENEIVLKPCSVMVYVADGGPLPDFPVANKVDKYVDRHWLPVTICRA